MKSPEKKACQSDCERGRTEFSQERCDSCKMEVISREVLPVCSKVKQAGEMVLDAPSINLPSVSGTIFFSGTSDLLIAHV